MGFNVPKQPLDYQLVGGVETFSKELLESLGYKLNYSLPKTSLVYSKSNGLDGTLFIDTQEGKKYLSPTVIKTLYDLPTAKEEFPELFI